MQYKSPNTATLLCPSCGSTLVGGDCVECDRPRATARGLKHAAPARLYAEPASRAVEPIVDGRRPSGEWMARPKDDAPQTRRAHPTQVRSALVEAELKAKMKAEAAAVRATGPATGPSVIVAQSGMRPRAGAPSREGGRSTAPRVRAVTPRPPEPPQLYLEPLVAAAPEAPPALVVDAQPEPQPVAEPAARPRQIWMVAAAVAACGVLAVIILL